MFLIIYIWKLNLISSNENQIGKIEKNLIKKQKILFSVYRKGKESSEFRESKSLFTAIITFKLWSMF